MSFEQGVALQFYALYVFTGYGPQYDDRMAVEARLNRRFSSTTNRGLGFFGLLSVRAETINIVRVPH